MGITQTALLALATLVVSSTGFAADSVCAPGKHMDYVCGIPNPEDLVAIPGDEWLLSSSMAPSGGIYAINASSRKWHQLYTEQLTQVQHDAATYPSCNTPPALPGFLTHGLHLRTYEDGTSTLYVVGHGGREAIEVFNVAVQANGPTLVWKGCVAMPDGTGANSVTSLRDGTLLATVLMHPGQSFADVFAGKVTGAVYRWSPGDSGFTALPGTELPGNNGIEVSNDEQVIYVASTGLSSLFAYSNTTPARLLWALPSLDFRPDNVHMGRNGNLITAGPSNFDHQCGPLDTGSAALEEFAACPRGSVAATFDAATLKETARWSSPPDHLFNNATMAIEVNGEVWVGSFHGGRIAILPAQPRPAE